MGSWKNLVKRFSGSQMVVDQNNGKYLTVKAAGGATAQCLALMNALFLRDKNLKPFKIKYFPHSTGTYWPFAIKFLLEKLLG